VKYFVGEPTVSTLRIKLGCCELMCLTIGSSLSLRAEIMDQDYYESGRGIGARIR